MTSGREQLGEDGRLRVVAMGVNDEVAAVTGPVTAVWSVLAAIAIVIVPAAIIAARRVCTVVHIWNSRCLHAQYPLVVIPIIFQPLWVVILIVSTAVAAVGTHGGLLRIMYSYFIGIESAVVTSKVRDYGLFLRVLLKRRSVVGVAIAMVTVQPRKVRDYGLSLRVISCWAG